MFNHSADYSCIFYEFYEPNIWVALVLVFQHNIRIITGILRNTCQMIA